MTMLATMARDMLEGGPAEAPHCTALRRVPNLCINVHMYKPTPAAETLTERQQQVLKFIRDCIASDGLPPTRAEIAQALGFSSPNAAEQHVKALVNKGVLEWVPGASRGLRLVGVQKPRLPPIGPVAARSPNPPPGNV